MIDWFFIFIPILVSVIILIFWLHKVVWWEVLLLIVPSALIILLMNTIMVAYNTSDTEYLGSYITKVNYYEPWNERVSCRHPIYCTRTYPCGTAKSPRTCTSTYVCGHVHPYDVDYHPEEWTKEDNFKDEYSISQSEFNSLRKLFATKEYFVELDRDYHTIDGDAYCTDWAGEPERSSVITKEGSYTNKIRASHSVFKFEDIDEKEVKRWSLYDYPEVTDYKQKVVLGKKIDGLTERKLQYVNGYYGPKKQFKLFVLFFKNQSMDVANKQRSYWEGGNKNEFVVCIGVDNSGRFEWVDAFSWMSKPALEAEVEDFIMNHEDVKLKKFADWLPGQVAAHWKRRDFKDFEYLQMELTETQIWWVMIILTIYNIVMSLWVINNEVENKFMPDAFSNGVDKIITSVKNFFVITYSKFIIFVKSIKNKFIKNDESNQ
jgi:hypothetical protein